MRFALAFTYGFDDKDWANKLLIVFALSFASVVLLPLLFVGLVPLCIVLGYMLEIVNNVRARRDIILPPWGRYEEKLGRGARVLTAIIVYNLPQTLFLMCLFFVPGAVSGGAGSAIFTLLMLCCALPFIVIYTAISWPVLAQGTVRFAAGDPPKILFQAGLLYEGVQKVGGYAAQWLLYAAGAFVIIAIIGLIPFVGWLVGSALMIPVQGHLLGQYAIHVDASRKRS